MSHGNEAWEAMCRWADARLKEQDARSMERRSVWARPAALRDRKARREAYLTKNLSGAFPTTGEEAHG